MVTSEEDIALLTRLQLSGAVQPYGATTELLLGHAAASGEDLSLEAP